MSEKQNISDFDPQAYLIKVQGGKDYLPVKDRLVWFRKNCPEGTIETEFLHIDYDKQFAVCRAKVTTGSGGSATGTKSQSVKGFKDWIEKAEMGAVGRALAMLRFGTQFTGIEFDEEEQIVDSPVTPKEEEPIARAKKSPLPAKEPTAIATITRGESLETQKKRVAFFKNHVTTAEWDGFCTFCQIGREPKVWSTDHFASASEKLNQYSITDSMKATLVSGLMLYDVAVMKGLHIPVKMEDLESLTALPAGQLLDTFASYRLITELATVLDPGYKRLKAIGARDGQSLDEPLDLFTLGLKDKSQGKDYTEILKEILRKNPKAIDRLPEDIRRDFASTFEAILKPEKAAA